MSELTTLARPYAEAIFSIAKEEGAVDDWSSVLSSFSEAFEYKELVSLIQAPDKSVSEKAAFFTDVFDSSSKENHESITRFVNLLSENGRLSLLPVIAKLFALYQQKEEGIQEGVVFSAYPLSGDQLSALQPELESIFKTKLRLSSLQSPDLIGGIRVVVGDRVFDDTVFGHVTALSTKLQNLGA